MTEPTESAVYELLNELGVAYQRVSHAPAATMEDCIKIDEQLGVEMCKNLFLCNRQKTAFYLLMMPADKEFRTKDLSRQINSARLSFAGAEWMQEFLGLQPGAVSVLGLMNDKDHRVQLLIDEDVLQKEFVGCHPCVNTASLKMTVRDLTEKFLLAVGHDPIMVTL